MNLRQREVAYRAAIKSAPGGRPPSGMESKYILTGFIECGHCHGPMVVWSRDMKRGRRKYIYRCANRHLRGTCQNGAAVPMKAADSAVLNKIQEIFTTPSMLEYVLDRYAAQILQERADSRSRDKRKTVTAEIANVEAQVKNLTEGVAKGGDIPALVDALKIRVARLSTLRLDLERLNADAATPLNEKDLEHMKNYFALRLLGPSATLRRQPEVARSLLKVLLRDRLVFTPVAGHPACCYRFEGRATLGPILNGMVRTPGWRSPEVPDKDSVHFPRTKALVTPAGFEPAISTLKGSRPRPG